jgi:phosphohistidine phosphatase
MRRLLLLRHAHANTPPGVDDKHRPLSAQGMNDALALGKLMKAKGYIPDFIICSPARRAQQTMRKLLESFGDIPAVQPPSAYYTSTGQLYELLKMVDGNKQCALLIAHNPSIQALGKFLCGLGDDAVVRRMRSEYKECTLSVFKCPIDGWMTLMPNENDLEDLLIQGEDFG